MALSDVLSSIGGGLAKAGQVAADVLPVAGQVIGDVADPDAAKQRLDRQNQLMDAARDAKAKAIEGALGTMPEGPDKQALYQQYFNLYPGPQNAGNWIARLRQHVSPSGAVAQGPMSETGGLPAGMAPAPSSLAQMLGNVAPPAPKGRIAPSSFLTRGSDIHDDQTDIYGQPIDTSPGGKQYRTLFGPDGSRHGYIPADYQSRPTPELMHYNKYATEHGYANYESMPVEGQNAAIQDYSKAKALETAALMKGEHVNKIAQDTYKKDFKDLNADQQTWVLQRTAYEAITKKQTKSSTTTPEGLTTEHISTSGPVGMPMQPPADIGPPPPNEPAVAAPPAGTAAVLTTPPGGTRKAAPKPVQPTAQPAAQPTVQPVVPLTVQHAAQPTAQPAVQPVAQPGATPTTGVPWQPIGHFSAQEVQKMGEEWDQKGIVPTGSKALQGMVRGQMPAHGLTPSPALTAGLVDKLTQRKTALDNTIRIMDDIEKDADLLQKLPGASLTDLAENPGSISRLAGFFTSAADKTRIDRLAGNIRSLQEHINVMRSPLGATGFRGEQGWQALQSQGVRIMGEPGVNKQVLENSKRVLSSLSDATDRILNGKPLPGTSTGEASPAADDYMKKHGLGKYATKP